MSRSWFVFVSCVVVAGAVAIGVVGVVKTNRSGGSGYAPRIDPAGFTSTIDNPFLPLRPGTRWVYSVVGADGKASRAVVEVTSETRRVQGVTCVVVRDTVTADGQVVEDTMDWYAQDVEGNVWYFGENSKEFRAGKQVGSGESWQAGAGDAQPGIVMKAAPKVGDRYRQEYHPGRAEDMAQVLSLGQRVSVPFGFFENARVVKHYTPLRPGLVQHRFYAPGVGLVHAVTVQGGAGYAELIEMTRD